MSGTPNRDQVEGKARQAAGQVEEAVGALVDDKETRVKGVAKEAEGKVQEVVGNVKKAVHDATK